MSSSLLWKVKKWIEKPEPSSAHSTKSRNGSLWAGNRRPKILSSTWKKSGSTPLTSTGQEQPQPSLNIRPSDLYRILMFGLWIARYLTTGKEERALTNPFFLESLEVQLINKKSIYIRKFYLCTLSHIAVKSSNPISARRGRIFLKNAVRYSCES